MTINLDTLRKRAELPNALHGCTSNPCGSVVCQTARDRDALLSLLEQAEQAVARVLEVIHQYDPDCLTCMCNSDGDCVKCTVADFQEALDGHTRG